MSRKQGLPALNRSTKAALNEGLDDLTEKLAITGTWPDYRQSNLLHTFFKTLSAQEPWRSHLTFLDFFEVLSGAIKRHGMQVDGESRKLVDLLAPNEVEQFRGDVRDYLLSLPRDYELWVELPAMPQMGEGSVRLTDRLELIERNPPKEEKPKRKRNLLLEILYKKEGDVWMRIQTRGYGSGRLDTTAVADGISELKRLFQMFRRLPVYKQESGLFLALGDPKAHCFLKDPAYQDVRMDIALPDRLNKFLVGVSIDVQSLEYFDSSKGALHTGTLGFHRPPQNRNEFNATLLDNTRWITRLMNCPTSWPDAERIRSAFEWAFDSAENDNQTLAFIQACIGLEALLGDDNQDEPLVARLADRCAYLLGESHNDRKAIRKRFKDTYAVRSKLVHGRSARLSLSDARHLTDAQSILDDVITGEATRLLRALDKQEGKKG